MLDVRFDVIIDQITDLVVVAHIKADQYSFVNIQVGKIG